MGQPLRQGLVVGRYRLDELLGRGGMGEVWSATHTGTARSVALKFLSAHAPPESAARRRFLREARAAAAVNHPNVVPIHDLFESEEGTPVMVMERLHGETLRHRLARETVLPLRDVVDILRQIVSAVGTAHGLGIVHRDLKPDNVFLAHGVQGRVDVRVLDFGIVKLIRATAGDTGVMTSTGTMLGTPCYMSPEQSFGERDIDHRTDVWSLGVMLYEALSGTLPVVGDNLGQVIKNLVSAGITPIEVLVPDLPEPIASLVARMLSHRREDRPSDLREVERVLKPFGTVEVPAFGPAVSEQHATDFDLATRLEEPDPSPDLASVDPVEPAPVFPKEAPQETHGPQSLSVRPSAQRSVTRTVVVALALGSAALGARLALSTRSNSSAIPGDGVSASLHVPRVPALPPPPKATVELRDLPIPVEPSAAPSSNYAAGGSAPNLRAVTFEHRRGILRTPRSMSSSEAPAPSGAVESPAKRSPNGLIDDLPF